MPPLFQQQTSPNEVLEIFYLEEDQDGEVTEHRQAVLGQPTTLYCDTNAIPPPQFSWYKDGEPLAPGPRVLMLLGNGHGSPVWGLRGFLQQVCGLRVADNHLTMLFKFLSVDGETFLQV